MFKINLIIIGIISGFVFGLVVYLLLRETPEKNLRMAQKHHKKGEDAYQKGNYDESKLQYEIARQYRERAFKKGEI